MFNFLSDIPPDEKILIAYQVKTLAESGFIPDESGNPRFAQISREIAELNSRIVPALSPNRYARLVSATMYDWIYDSLLKSVLADETIKNSAGVRAFQKRTVAEGRMLDAAAERSEKIFDLATIKRYKFGLERPQSTRSMITAAHFERSEHFLLRLITLALVFLGSVFTGEPHAAVRSVKNKSKDPLD